MFLNYLPEGTLAYDIEPEDERVNKQDYLTLDLPYKQGRCVIGNPPFGRANCNLKKFYKKCVGICDYISFVMPISQYKNNYELYDYDLIYSEDLGERIYTDREIRCCFNIYKRPINNKLNPKPNYKLSQVQIFEHHRTNHPILNDDYDYRICSFGAIGKECKANTYCKELCFKINNEVREEVLNLLHNTNYKKEFPSVSVPYVADWQIYKYIKEQIPEIK